MGRVEYRYRVGTAWLYCTSAARAAPTTMLALASALFSTMVLIAIGYGFPNASTLAESMFVILGVPRLVYGATLFFFVRGADVSPGAAAACGLIGLVPLYWIGGYTLILTACSFGTGGC